MKQNVIVFDGFNGDFCQFRNCDPECTQNGGLCIGGKYLCPKNKLGKNRSIKYCNH